LFIVKGEGGGRFLKQQKNVNGGGFEVMVHRLG
jgi:hypothetical protein